ICLSDTDTASSLCWREVASNCHGESTRDSRACVRILESLLSLLRMHWDHEPPKNGSARVSSPRRGPAGWGQPAPACGSWKAPSVLPPRIGTMNRIVLVVLVLETESASRGRGRARGRRLRFVESGSAAEGGRRNHGATAFCRRT